jgi:hypothetical protein
LVYKTDDAINLGNNSLSGCEKDLLPDAESQ